MTISGQPSKTDWDRVRKSIVSDEPIACDPSDPDDGSYDPNDDGAVAQVLTEANLVFPAKQVEKKIAKAL